jgi:predicted PurR-regulated permease PerM
MLVSYALDPIVTRLTRLRLNRALAAALVLGVLVWALGFAAYSLRGQAVEAFNSLPETVRTLREALHSGGGSNPAIQKVKQTAKEIEKVAAEASAPPAVPQGVTPVQVQEPPFKAADYLLWGSRGAVAFGGQITIIFFLVFFLLASGDLYKRKLVKIAGNTFSEKRLTVQILHEIDDQIEKFLIVRIITSLFVAVATWLALWLLGLKQAAIWGIAAGVLNTIPYLGPIIVSAGLAVVAFLQFGMLSMVVYVSGAALLVTAIEGFLLTPALVGRAAQMNQVAVFVGLLFWGWMWGLWGAILAVPILMVTKVTCDRIDGLQGLAEFLAERSD